MHCACRKKIGCATQNTELCVQMQDTKKITTATAACEKQILGQKDVLPSPDLKQTLPCISRAFPRSSFELDVNY